MSLPLFQALERYDAHLRGPIRVQRWAGGVCNRVFRLSDADRILALRLNEPDSNRLGVDREREATLLRTLQGQPWVPELVCVDEVGLLTGWVEGAAPELGEGMDINALISSLSRVHAQRPDVPSLNMADQIRHLLPQGPRLPEAIETELRRQCDAYPWPDTLTLCHHDWHPGNLVVHGDDWVVLDWEFAALGDPAMDAAAACQGFQLSDDQCQVVCRSLQLENHRFHRAQSLMEAVALVWYRANPQAGRGELPSLDTWFQRWGQVF